ncbi:MAG TPA: DUF1579 family protein [Nannocystaceae bacterium]|nr:DUF1579 family protein [Nannocystaceae bacterium]
MQMPEPSPEHRKLASLAGEWVGEEILHPSPWSPETRRALGRFSMRMAVDDLFLVNDYEEERDGRVVFRGHGVYGWDAPRERYTMHWFDSMGGSPSETLGVWSGDELVFTNQGEQGHGRYIYSVHGPDRLGFRIETSRDGHEWATLMEGAFKRVRAAT